MNMTTKEKRRNGDRQGYLDQENPILGKRGQRGKGDSDRQHRWGNLHVERGLRGVHLEDDPVLVNDTSIDDRTVGALLTKERGSLVCVSLQTSYWFLVHSSR